MQTRHLQLATQLVRRPICSRHVVMATRTLASHAPPFSQPPSSSAPFEVFDRQAKRAQKDRAAVRRGGVDEDGIGGLKGGRSRVVDYLKAEVAERMGERFEVRR
jgi:NADH dehydrogenase [ubiquinone] 1 alpha subcomplex assembly factor 5